MNVDQRVEKAMAIRANKYNCAQTVIGAYEDMVDVPFDDLMKLAESLGGGIAGTGGACGVLTGATIVMGLIKGVSEANPDHKFALNKEVQGLIKEFNDAHGTINCFELKGEVNPQIRLKDSTCNELIFETVRLIDKYL